MDYLLDTTTLSYVIDGNRLVNGRLKAAAASGAVYASVISEGELTYGALRLGKERRRELIKEISLLLNDLAGVLPVTRAVASLYGAIKRDLAVAGQLIPANDLWIAAVAAERDCALIAHDRHFAQVTGLHVEDWFEP